MKKLSFSKRFAAIALVWSMSMLPIAITAQTRVEMPKNKYKVADDVKIGRDASVDIEKQFPILNDSQAENYVESVGERLVRAIPEQFREPDFDYRFKVVNASDINAFALPGGPMYVNRGMIQAAANEGEMAGVMAHEISHVALRHATAQATKQGSWQNQLGMLGMILGGAILGGQAGAQFGMLGAQAWMTKYSRDYETQADVLGARIMADAGYDPRDLANMFRTIARQGSGGGPEWLSSHPDPGNRFEKINREAQYLDVSSNPIKVTREFSRVKERLAAMPPARTMAEIQKAYESGQTQQQSPIANGRYSTNVSYPSSRMRTYTSGGLRMNVPQNWEEFGSSDLIFAPKGAYGNQGITHGMMVGVFRSNGSNAQAATQEYLRGVLQANTYLRQNTNLSRRTIASRTGYTTRLIGRSPIHNRNEVVDIYTISLGGGDLLYIAAVAPQNQLSRYSSTFNRIVNSVRISQ